MVEITSIKGASVQSVNNALEEAFVRAGFQYTSRQKSSTSLTYPLEVAPTARGLGYFIRG
jgi:hypothetical protein